MPRLHGPGHGVAPDSGSIDAGLMILPARYSPRLGLAGAFIWAMPPWRRVERVRELAGSLGVERTSVFSGLTPAQVLQIQQDGH
jgi:hypothetical protein